jgi:hypothetical protein
LSQVVKIVGVLCNFKTKIKTTDMKMYYVNSFPDGRGEYKVHEEGCSKLAGFLSREFLNLSTSPEAAIKKAQKLHRVVSNDILAYVKSLMVSLYRIYLR